MLADRAVLIVLAAHLALGASCAKGPAASDTPAGDASTAADGASADASSADAGRGDTGVIDAAASSPGADAGVEIDAGGPGDAGAEPSMLLTVQMDSLTTPDGEEVDFKGAISCCGGGYGWPLFDEAWIDHVAVYDVSFLHVRLGPFLTGEGGEPDWAPVGGGYVESGGRADLASFNEPFWERVAALIEAARARRMWVEVDVVDGWAIRHCRNRDIPEYSAWSPDNNVQGEDLCADAGSAAIVPGGRHEAWVRKVVAATGGFDNVIYQDGNEVGLIDRYDRTWTESIAAIVRDEESRRGFLQHLFGTNSGDPSAIASPLVDIVELHANGAPDVAECFGKPCLVNEYNPRPPLSPENLHARWCAARAQRIYFWYWRHGQDDSAMDRSLELIAGGCP